MPDQKNQPTNKKDNMEKEENNSELKITVRRYYYQGQCPGPHEEFLRDPYTDADLVFESIGEARSYLVDLMGLEHDGGDVYSASGDYITSHGEYERPSYKIVYPL